MEAEQDAMLSYLPGEPQLVGNKLYIRGSGICPECNGTGRNDAAGVLATYGCTLCDKTGECYKCWGIGELKLC